MIEYIIRHTVKNYSNTTDKKVREQYSIVGGILGIICNLFLFIGKFLVGMTSGSIAIISDAFNNLSDMGSSFISIISAKLSNRPPDEDHPFGHGRFEYLASLTFAIFGLFAALPCDRPCPLICSISVACMRRQHRLSSAPVQNTCTA